jgi:serine/threonine protein kinase
VGDATVSLMVEYMNGGSLQDLVDSGGCDDAATLASIAKQALKGLRFLHRGRHLHRDVKVTLVSFLLPLPPLFY